MTNSPTKHAKRLPRGVRVLLAVAAGVAAAGVLVCSVLGVLYYRGKLSLTGRGSTLSAPESLAVDADDDLHRVTYKGTTYRYNKNVVSILFMGVDKDDIQDESGYGKNGQADSLFVAVIDNAAGVTRIIPLSRESMVDVNIYGVGGAYSGVEKTQLCLAYAYGATGEESCRNVLRSVKRLLYGVDIDAYAAIDLKGVATLTDAIGGVPLTVSETIRSDKYAFEKGAAVTLNGQQAIHYIQYRDDDVNANNRRIQRQRQFLGAFISKAKAQIKGDMTRLTAYYTAAEPYLVTDLSLSRLTYIAGSSLEAAGNMEYLHIEGDTVMGEKYVEFYPDSTSVYEAVLTAFYTPEE